MYPHFFKKIQICYCDKKKKKILVCKKKPRSVFENLKKNGFSFVKDQICVVMIKKMFFDNRKNQICFYMFENMKKIFFFFL